MDELFASGIKLAYHPGYSFIFDNGDETEASKVKSNRVNCPLFEVCLNWTLYHKNVSVLLSDTVAEEGYALGHYFGENPEPLLCGLEDWVVYRTGLTIVMFYGDPLMKRVTEIIDRFVEAGLYNYWISVNMELRKIRSRSKAIVQPLDEYYSFNFYHMQPAFYLLLMGWCLSVIFFLVEVLFNCIITKRMLNW
jgi:hypothetical protein